jgi:hypothetical protein
MDAKSFLRRTGSRLIGSPPGYVGYEEGGQLSEAVRRRIRRPSHRVDARPRAAREVGISEYI